MAWDRLRPDGAWSSTSAESVKETELVLPVVAGASGAEGQTAGKVEVEAGVTKMSLLFFLSVLSEDSWMSMMSGTGAEESDGTKDMVRDVSMIIPNYFCYTELSHRPVFFSIFFS